MTGRVDLLAVNRDFPLPEAQLEPGDPGELVVEKFGTEPVSRE